MCVSSASEQSGLMPHINSPLCQSPSPSYSLSYHCEMWPFFPPSNSRSQPSHFSLALVASMSLKIKLTHSASLLCRCNYKSSLLLCERGEERASGPVRGPCGWGGSSASPAESALDRPWGSNLLRRQVNQSSGSHLDCAHIQRCTWVEMENTAVTQCGLRMPLPEKGQHPTETNRHYASEENQALLLWSLSVLIT